MALIGNIKEQLGSSEARQPLCSPARASFMEFSGARFHEGGRVRCWSAFSPRVCHPCYTALLHYLPHYRFLSDPVQPYTILGAGPTRRQFYRSRRPQQ